MVRPRDLTGGRSKVISKKHRKIQPMVCGAYVQGRSVREISQAFGIPSNKTFYRIIDPVRSKAKEGVCDSLIC
ncbi:hypothetical protein [Persicitalea sp.]|uniref:hypothetical protein n=1 Tax=Persicitalea sp. TaxID=3100273 RepID=UPI0035943EC5